MTWRNFHGSEHLRSLQSIYTPALSAMLCEKHKLTGYEAVVLEALREGAHWFMLLEADKDSVPAELFPPDRLRKFAHAMRQAASALQDYDLVDSLCFDLASWGEEENEPLLKQEGDLARSGRTSERREERPTRDALHIVSILARSAEGMLRSSKPRGRPRDTPTEAFCYQVSLLWECDLDRRFTVDYHKGAALTPALSFLIDAAAPLKIPHTALITAARKQVREIRAHKNWPDILSR